MSWCGKGCTAHKITVRSEVAQEVFITLNTWDRRSLPNKCKSLLTKYSSIGPGPDGINRTFRGGSTQLPVTKFEAGESKAFHVELDFSSPDLPKDWSVTVWGKGGKVYVYNNDGTPSTGWEGSAPVKPALPSYDYGKYETWAKQYLGKESWDAKWY